MTDLPSEPTLRVDLALVERGLARSRTQAVDLVDSGQVLVNGVPARRPADQVRASDRLSADADPYVSRAAHKLRDALADLGLRPHGRALDAGASTGGFTQVLLEQGCAGVYAVDVGTDQLHPLLRADPRVRVHERTNLRDLTLAELDGRPVDWVVADVSFISLTVLVGVLTSVLDRAGSLLLMVKPQFEVGRERLGKGGVVRSPALHRAAVDRVVSAAADRGWHARALARSRHPGAAGNLEFFVLFTTSAPATALDLTAIG